MDISQLLNKTAKKSVAEILQIIANEFKNATIFTTSFGIEDQVITDIIFSNNLPIKVVSLDTGRLFEQTYKVQLNTITKYKKEIKVYAPQASSLEKLLSEKGPYSFYESIENRKECCNIRKVEPLNRALTGNKCWITGIRAEQSPNRTQMEMIENDSSTGLVKIHPLHDWTTEMVIDYLEKNNVPYSNLHHKGFVSIGCEPCTRAIQKGEDFRAGRWWWENNSGKECGLHSTKS